MFRLGFLAEFEFGVEGWAGLAGAPTLRPSIQTQTQPEVNVCVIGRTCACWPAKLCAGQACNAGHTAELGGREGWLSPPAVQCCLFGRKRSGWAWAACGWRAEGWGAGQACNAGHTAAPAKLCATLGQLAPQKPEKHAASDHVAQVTLYDTALCTCLGSGLGFWFLCG